MKHETPLTRNQKVQDAAFTVLFFIVGTMLLVGMSACVVWWRL
jgi:hypothetical protein